jgi:hypothetical protein
VDSDGLKGELISPVSATTKARPDPPSGLSAPQTPNGILLRWTRSPSPDTDQYIIFTKGFLNTEIGRTPATEFLYTDEVQPSEELRFTVRAMDSHGLESDYSQPVVLRIPAAAKKEKTGAASTLAD